MLPHSPFSSPPTTPRFVVSVNHNPLQPPQPPHSMLVQTLQQQPLTPLYTPSPPFSPPPTAQHYLTTTSQSHEGFSFHQLHQNPHFGHQQQQPFQQQLYTHSPLQTESNCHLTVPVVTKRRRAQDSLDGIEEDFRREKEENGSEVHRTNKRHRTDLNSSLEDVITLLHRQGSIDEKTNLGGMMEDDDDNHTIHQCNSDGVVHSHSSSSSLQPHPATLSSSMSCTGIDPVRSFVRRRLEASQSKHNLMMIM
eukprot:TRINITY_DN474_c0_g1_i1.p1 TRINITY_DN474_c0_g1~~TRINITY_DN474_c0_g1_i1.p1  ORF type:complete len:250 (+),score=47.35 TRINITY_DN474_c0_g1_i1:118-867(+)